MKNKNIYYSINKFLKYLEKYIWIIVFYSFEDIYNYFSEKGFMGISRLTKGSMA